MSPLFKLKVDISVNLGHKGNTQSEDLVASIEHNDDSNDYYDDHDGILQ